jgi:transcription elongation factor/antiterminator RfaH
MEEKKQERKKWYVLYTKSRQEKKVRDRFGHEDIECYLPLEKKLRIWSDRKKWVDEPLFRSYIFVRVDISDYNEYLKVLQTEGVVHFVRIEKNPVIVRDELIEAIRQYEKMGEFVSEEEEKQLKVGDSVEIIRGSLKGLFGTLVEIGRKRKVRIMLEAVRQSIYLTVPKSYLQKVQEKNVERRV